MGRTPACGCVIPRTALLCFLALRTQRVTGAARSHSWDFRFAASDRIVDSVGGINATLMNGAATDRTATGILLDGYTQHLVVDFGAAVQLGGALTIEAVVRFAAFNSNSRIFDCGNGQLDSIFVGNVDTSGQLVWAVMRADVGKHVLSDAEAELPPQVWFHIVTTIDDTAMEVYVDGVKQGESSAGWEPKATSRLNCYIGQSNWVGGYFAGEIAAFSIYSGAMTPDDVKKACIAEDVCIVPVVPQPTRLELLWDAFRVAMCFGLDATHTPTWCFPTTFTVSLTYVALTALLACYTCVCLPFIALRRSFVQRTPCLRTLGKVCTYQCRRKQSAPMLRSSTGRALAWCEWSNAREAHDLLRTERYHFLTEADLDFRETLIGVLSKDVAASDLDVLQHQSSTLQHQMPKEGWWARVRRRAKSVSSTDATPSSGDSSSTGLQFGGTAHNSYH